MTPNLREPVCHVLSDTGALACERGGRLERLDIAYVTWGQINPARDNVIWILHPLTCSANPSEWWPDFVGPGKPIDPAVHYIVCVNSLGSCYGTTGPASIDPRTGKPYGSGFPPITLKDVVAVHERVRRHLGLGRIALGIGGSYGGQQLIEWMAAEPSLFDHACVIGAGLRQSPWATAFNESQRMALEADPTFLSDVPGGGTAGLAAARSIAVLSYRTAQTYERTQCESDDAVCDHFRASSYQRHVGAKFTRRFDAHAYWTLTKVMDSHNPARGRATLGEVIGRITTRVLIVALECDVLFPRSQLRATARAFADGQLAVIESDFGHDSILTHASQIAAAITRLLFDLRPSEARNARCA